jgi:hypothetical protein
LGKNKIQTIIIKISEILLLILKARIKELSNKGIHARKRFQLRNKNTFVSLI